MKILLLFTLILTLTSCQSQRITEKKGKLEGVTGVFEGNCMPSPGVPPCKPRPISTTLYFTSPSREFSMALLRDSVVSDEAGKYQVWLPSGRYSLFMKDEDDVVCIEERCDPDCVCLPFEIRPDSTTILNPNLNHATW